MTRSVVCAGVGLVGGGGGGCPYINTYYVRTKFDKYRSMYTYYLYMYFHNQALLHYNIGVKYQAAAGS